MRGAAACAAGDCAAGGAAPPTQAEFVQAVEFPYYLYPQNLWERELVWLKTIGIQTVEFSIPWNWHQIAPGDFDFTGRTSPRRDLAGFIKMLRRVGLHGWARTMPPVDAWPNRGFPPGVSAASPGRHAGMAKGAGTRIGDADCEPRRSHRFCGGRACRAWMRRRRPGRSSRLRGTIRTRWLAAEAPSQPDAERWSGPASKTRSIPKAGRRTPAYSCAKERWAWRATSAARPAHYGATPHCSAPGAPFWDICSRPPAPNPRRENFPRE